MTNRIRYYRKKRGFSQRKLAVCAYCSESTLSSWEKGYRIPRVDTAICLAHALGVTLDDLFGEEQSCK